MVKYRYRVSSKITVYGRGRVMIKVRAGFRIRFS
jgi:hypothetical protein